VINEVSAISDVTVYRCTISNWATGVYFQGSSPAARATGMVAAYCTFMNNNVGVSNDFCDSTIAWTEFQGSLAEAIGIGPGANVAAYHAERTTPTDVVGYWGGFLYEANFLMLSLNSTSEYVQPGETIGVTLNQAALAQPTKGYKAMVLPGSVLD